VFYLTDHVKIDYIVAGLVGLPEIPILIALLGRLYDKPDQNDRN
jgi:hypothetical protein